MKRGILYAPDYAINAGGLINIYYEGGQAGVGGYNKQAAFDHCAKIGATVAQILERSKAEKKPSFLIADTIVEEKLAKARAAQAR